MGLFSFGKGKPPTLQEVKPSPQLIDKKDKNFIVKAIGLISQYGTRRGEFQEPEYDLEEIKLAAEADSYINIALRKYDQLIYKAGVTLKSENEEAVNYIKTRFKIMGYMTDKPMDILFQEIAEDMVKYSNAFLLKSRVERVGFGVKAKSIGNNLLPIGGYFRAAPETIKIKRDKHGTVIGYEQHNDHGETKKFAPSEVIHFYMDRDGTHAYGTPRISAALEDVKLLRRIEGNVLSLIYRFAMPLYQWKIGLPEHGLQATPTEIDDARREVENMALDGMVFTNERTEIKAIGAEGNALDATNYLAYFEKRVFTSLGVSESQMGRNSTSNSADSMEAQTHDTVKHIQRVLRIFIENFIINELLLEGGFNPIINEEDEVHYEFNEISLDTKIKVENHEMLKFQSNINTYEESRINMGMGNKEIDEERLYSNMITKKVAIDQMEAQTECSIKIADVNAEHNMEAQRAASSQQANTNTSNKSNSSSSSSKNNSSIKSTSGKKSGNQGSVNAKKTKDVETRNRPTNQHGTTSVKIRESFETTEEEQKIENKIYNKYKKLRNVINEGKIDIDLAYEQNKLAINSLMDDLIQESILQGKSDAEKDLNTNVDDISIKDLNVLYDEINDTLNNLYKDINKHINKLETKTNNDIQDILDTYEYRLNYLIEYIKPKTYWYSYVLTGATTGKKKAYIEFNSKKDKETHTKEVNLSDFSLEDIPAFHAFCKCKVSFEKGGGK